MNPRSYRSAQLFWIGLYAFGAAVAGAFWWNISGYSTHADLYSRVMAIGHITGILGAYCIVWQVLLLSRLTPLEDAFGLERVTKLHKWNGYTALTLLLVHTLALTLAYASLNQFTVLQQFIDFNLHWEDLLKASVGMALLIGIVGLSIGIVRMKLKYETWFYVHLFVYVAILLAFSHQFSDGADFVGHTINQLYWYALYGLAALSILVFRVGRPLYLLNKHRFRISQIVRETPDVISIYIRGRRLGEFKFRPGQFVIWRFLDKQHILQGHPFSLSAGPNDEFLRLTVKQLGDFTRSLDHLKPGTPVLLDGPHGHFTTETLSQAKVLMIAGGVGITPIRSMLEQLPEGVTNVALIYAAKTRADFALWSELEALIRAKGGTLRYVLSHETAPGFAAGLLDDEMLRTLVPDAADREVILCGPPAMMESVTQVLRRQGVRRSAIHTERFAY
jgi:predicted ferric reductase